MVGPPFLVASYLPLNWRIPAAKGKKDKHPLLAKSSWNMCLNPYAPFIPLQKEFTSAMEGFRSLLKKTAPTSSLCGLRLQAWFGKGKKWLQENNLRYSKHWQPKCCRIQCISTPQHQPHEYGCAFLQRHSQAFHTIKPSKLNE